METTRRHFLHFLGWMIAVLPWRSGLVAAEPAETTPQIHWATRNTALGAVGRGRRLRRPGPSFKAYPGAAITRLPAPAKSSHALAQVLRDYATSPGFAPKPISLGVLATLLHHTNGVTDSQQTNRVMVRRRAAPSAGALYAGEVYVVVERVRGLDAGVYSYSVRDHALKLIGQGAQLDRVGQALERPGSIENAAAAVLLTNVFERYSWRYANRAYRYALIDSGHIGENLRLTARSIGIADRCLLRFWDDSLNELLGLDGRNEAVCAMHVVGHPDATAKAPSISLAQRFVEKQQTGSVEIGGAVTEQFHEATKLLPIEAPIADRTKNEPIAEVADPGLRLKLQSSSPSQISVSTAIRQRRSARSFEPSSVSLPELSFVLEAAQGNRALERSAGVELYVVAHALEGAETGVHRYLSSTHELTLVRKGEIRREMVRACLRQEMGGIAGVGLVMAARLDDAQFPLGDRRYRDLLLEAGAIGQRIYLAAEALGLAARNLAAYEDERFNKLLWLDRRGLQSLHLTMLGHGD